VLQRRRIFLDDVESVAQGLRRAAELALLRTSSPRPVPATSYPARLGLAPTAVVPETFARTLNPPHGAGVN
jgi:hypothetical protein